MNASAAKKPLASAFGGYSRKETHKHSYVKWDIPGLSGIKWDKKLKITWIGDIHAPRMGTNYWCSKSEVLTPALDEI